MKELYCLFWLSVVVCAFGCDATIDREDEAEDTSQDSDTGSGIEAQSDAGADGGETDTGGILAGEGCKSMDILFVIDNSGSMAEEQQNLVTNFPKFIEVLEDYETGGEGGLIYRVGVTNTEVQRSFSANLIGIPMPMSQAGADGALIGQSKCGFALPWIDGPGDNVADDFSCAAKVGITGGGIEMPFAAIEAALGKQSDWGPNQGFYRKDEESLLVIIIITDEDDCSVENGGTVVTAGGVECDEATSKKLYTVEYIKDFLDEETGGEGRYVVIGVAGPTACGSQFGSATEARRIKRLVDMVSPYGFFGDICQGDLWTSLQEALEVMKITCSGWVV